MFIFSQAHRAAIVSAVLLGVGFTQAHAATFTVTNTSDSTSVDGSCSAEGSGDGCTLREAVEAANTNANDPTQDIITFAPDVRGTISLQGDLTVEHPLDIQGPGAALLTIRRDLTRTYCLFSFVTPGLYALSGLTLSNGNNGQGGAVSNDGTLLVQNCVFSGNTGGNGGALFTSRNSVLDVQDSLFTNNSATGQGGAIYNGGQATIKNTTISDNTCANAAGDYGRGGAISSSSDDLLTIQNSTISGNTGVQTGGIDGLSPMLIENTLISGNTSTLPGFGGGGIDIYEGPATIRNSTIANNVSHGYGTGGGITCFGSLRLENSTISGNTSVKTNEQGENGGGGLFISDNGVQSWNNSVILNCTFTGNKIDGIDTFSGDSYGASGINCNGGTPSISNTIIGANFNSGDRTDVLGQFKSGGHNLVTSVGGVDRQGKPTLGGSKSFTGPGDITGNAVSPVNPKLGPLASNGGPTPTHALLDGSPAISAGATDLTVDQRGVPRPQGRADDIGAFEVANGAPLILSVTLAPENPKTNDTLRATVDANDPEGTALVYTYQWKKNGAVISGQTGATLNLATNGNGSKGDKITVVVSTTDGETPVSKESAPVTIGNSAPTLTTATINPASSTTAGILTAKGTATDPDSDELTYSYAWKKNGETIPEETGATLDLSKAGNGNQGDKISVVVTVSDGDATDSKESEAVTIAGSAPSAITLSSNTVTENQPSGTVIGSFSTTDADEGDTFTYSLVAGQGDSDNAAFTIKNNTLSTTAAFDFESKNSLSIRVKSTDSAGLSVEAVLTLNVLNANEAPTATVSLAPKAPTTTSVLQANVEGKDPEGDDLSYTYIWKKNGATITLATGATLDLSKPGYGDKGDKISVTVTPKDDALTGQSATTSVTVVNSAPTLEPKTFLGREGVQLTGTIVGLDADKDALTYSLVGGARYGTLKLQASGAFTYTPRANWNGTDRFSARVLDSSKAIGTAVFTLSIAPANGNPLAANDTVRGFEDTPLTIDAATLLRNDLNGENRGEFDSLRIVRVTAPAGFPGTVRLDAANQTILFTPKLNWSGTTSFTYTIQDSGRALASAKVTLQISPLNDAPVAIPSRLTVISGTPGELALAGTDAEGDALTFALSARPTNGAAQVLRVGNRYILRYQSKEGFVGTDTLSIIARDGRLNSAPATVTITVKPNFLPQLVGLLPNQGTFPAGSTIVFTQKVRDANGTAHLDATALLIGNDPDIANSSGGAVLWFDAVENRFTITREDGATTFAPTYLGTTLENSRVKVTLGVNDVIRDNRGNLTLRWRVTFKPSFTGPKSLWSRAEDLGGQSAGFTKQGEITLADPAASPAPSQSPSAPTS